MGERALIPGVVDVRFIGRAEGWANARISSWRTRVIEMEAVHPFRRSVLQVLLRDERFYHGDTCLCSFGPGRQALLAYLPVLAAHSAEALQRAFGERLISLEDDDAAIYAANSFSFERKGESFLVMPEGVSARVEEAVRAQDTRLLKIDVSEFHKKGGGSVKCMLGDLGVVVGEGQPGTGVRRAGVSIRLP